ncbi:MAG: 50S ribosomal protein L18 [Firmicutes bacterium]|nr:50S ribosomal protein L18 [Bacillota bacterium]MBR0105055.1 50S ribosomal protein L18 [Bacillota bacterium]MBR2594091.1 50S ribosomal protein L18 [Bacillota bacterium]
MINKPSRAVARNKRHYRIRNKVQGTAAKPRLAVFRSNNHIYAQIIDDTVGNTIAASSTLEAEVAGKVENTSNIEAAKAVGEAVAKKALDKGISEVVFDRGGYIYHGRVAALADAARQAGLKF